MESICIWYLTDNNEGIAIANKIADVGLDVKLLNYKDIKKEKIKSTFINIFIFDFLNIDPIKILSLIRDDQRIHNFQKFIILHKRTIKKALNTSMNFSHLELLTRPINKKEFILLLEKSVIVERYREVMKYISKEAEARIETYENLMDINRRDLFVTDKEKKNFKNILNYEKNLIKKQIALNKSIRDYTFLRQKEMFYNENRIKSEEMFEELRRQELVDNKMIKPQENLIEFPLNKHSEANRLDSDKDKVEELEREAVKLNRKLTKLQEKNEKQLAIINELKQELKTLKSNKRTSKHQNINN